MDFSFDAQDTISAIRFQLHILTQNLHISSAPNYQLPSKERRRTVPAPMKPLGSEHELWVLLVSCRLHVIQRQAGEILLVCGKFVRDGQELVLPTLRRPFRMVIRAEDLDSSR